MTYIIEGSTGPWEIVVGLEVHCQVVSKSKLFSGASTTFGNDPNTNVSLVDAAMPGMLPVINEECVRQAVKTGLGLKARINLESVFARKNYFYADLPQGYQISQFDKPIVGEGTIILDMPDGSTKSVGIERLHLEQDAGKSMHDQDPKYSHIDLNRSGVALMEIVSKPDIRTPEEAGAYLTKLRAIVRYLGTCDGNMNEGSMRCDANVSVRRPGAEFGTRCEIKNVNSIRYVMQAIEIEAKRQVEVIEAGGEIVQETRLYDPRLGETRSMRSKEMAHDYRYFPDPDLLPLVFDQAFVSEIEKTLPELPDEKKARFMRENGLSAYDAGVLVADQEKAAYYEVVAKGRDGKLAANWVITNLFGALNKLEVPVTESPVTAENLGKLLDLISDDTISGRIAKDVFEIMIETGNDPEKIVEEKGLKQITDTGAIETAIDEVIAANPDKVQEIRDGKDRMLGWFVGQVMKSTGGKANPGMVNQMLRDKILG
ncbi:MULTISPECIES: Asp-tRNA(Asn)/Glu-tRNA(Gln) amidotransferase subunit GatB [Thalassospira]|jgi:aspartyl-tRNA(Asn)/glutamyl-tRNA(Gln) amidotransferase subunit B|uniref:Aspartyl/glutamyl-tRNA(Asn/Gln) amidotransferase subunit B n=2 Tax=Thalassospira TaxID=168934 RepID=A0ABR5XX02_9PROT|nr:MULTISPECIES: Asp-tRNA(Asn)/Glu-tRNA(Gln) amidotransferase subunit GatB [Thalassospira]MBR9817881.1 Asp-tRNA(Asn)/Glu-tRNA(Gln) amidotransferase subunit GatB [Rhodospirillales bacterium]KEO59154.1 glutamyl-tRNA amidotransferase subunit B [Thalassospira permensis NBRC 106175]KZC97236.1 glutamyl-tRNA amidotransferase [Thalassospira xiamenensis]KZD10171.1 glutamyl-tRNA amidotransferase [Thalassospira xiamenensis]MAB34194.1 Asp-tRNA(Asn)/Glu-tRNA(Gln) amidotransferase GatCAB subunit B [Thalasso|tara:strand:+ start:14916 stop:16370 length:1455 start_codon:yes stop_codon:yes gene_type:complete